MRRPHCGAQFRRMYRCLTKTAQHQNLFSAHFRKFLRRLPFPRQTPPHPSNFLKHDTGCTQLLPIFAPTLESTPGYLFVSFWPANPPGGWSLRKKHCLFSNKNAGVSPQLCKFSRPRTRNNAASHFCCMPLLTHAAC